MESLSGFLRMIYVAFAACTGLMAYSSHRRQQSKKEKTVTFMLDMCAVSLAIFALTLYVDSIDFIDACFAVDLTLVTGMTLMLFEYTIQSTGLDEYYPSWLKYLLHGFAAVDMILDISNLYTHNLAKVHSIHQFGGYFWAYSQEHGFLYHCLLCYGLILAIIVILIYKMAVSPKVLRKKFRAFGICLITGTLLEVYSEYTAMYAMLPLNYLVFFSLGVVVYWDTYQNNGLSEVSLNQFIMNNLDTLVLMFGFAGKLEVYNDQAAAVFGLTDSDKSDLKIGEFCKRINLDLGAMDGVSEIRYEFDDDIYMVNHTKLVDEEHILGDMLIFRNINDEVVAERLQKQLMDGRNDFITNMTHEIRTPLNAVIGLSDQLMENTSGEEKDTITIIRNSGRVILRYVDFMFDILAMQDGVFELNMTNYSVAELSGQIEHEVRTRLNTDEQVFFDVRNDPRMPSVCHSDPAVIKQVLEIVLENAFKFTKRGRVVYSTKYIRKDARFGELEYVIRDTGSGMNEEMLENIYLAFSIGTNVSYKHETGIGLGLTVAKQLVDMLEGTIYIESNVGVGTTVTVRIPVEVVDATPMITNIRKTGLSDYAITCIGVRVLLVEDDALNAHAMVKLLESFKCRVYHVESGEEAIRYLGKNTDVDLILMDYVMPGMDGIETSRRIRSSDTSVRNIPIVAVTAEAGDGMKELFLSEGLSDCMFKPFERSELGDLLARWISPDKIVIQEKPKGGV